MPKVLRNILAASVLVVSAIAAQAQERPRIVAVNYPLHFFAERLAGDAAEVVFPVPEGIDPSFWRPSIPEISMIQSADLILLNGAGFAAWVDRVSLPRARVVNTSAAIEDRFIATESITHSHGDGGEHSHEGTASYIWLDPELAVAQAEAIAAALAARGLVPPDDVATRLDALRSELERLDAEARDALASVQGIPMIATHPRYHYLARRYDLQIASLEWEAGAMPGEEELAELEALVDETGARILIWEAGPPQTAIGKATSLGLESTIFDPIASNGSGVSFVDAFGAAVSDLADAVARVRAD